MAEVTLRGCGLEWKYPWEGEKIDLASGLTLKSYPTEYKNRRIACAMSHYRLWYESVEKNVPILILEHDAEFIEKFDPQPILDSKYDIVGINNPLMATRRAKQFFNIVEENKEELQPVPTIDEWNIPQGLAGNSAYIIKPNGAKSVIQAVKDYGMWPNDAIMCRQLIPNMGVTKVFYTKVQGLPSTTTG
jgi:GR25 family glycosyltransferase involved in LPS biosynthesis